MEKEEPEKFITITIISLVTGQTIAKIKGKVLEPGVTYCYSVLDAQQEIRIEWPLK